MANEVKKAPAIKSIKDRDKKVLRKIEYPFIGKESLTEFLKRIFPIDLIPTERIGYILGGIFLLVVIIAIIQVPYGQILKGDVNVTIGVGVPFSFLEFNMIQPEEAPLRLSGLVYDLIIYLFLSYIIEVLLNLMIKRPMRYFNKDRTIYPQVFKDRLPENLAEKATQKVVQKNIPMPTPPKAPPQKSIQKK